MSKDRALFYSGPGGYANKARGWARKKNNGYKILSLLWTDSRYPDAWQKDIDASEEFFNLASRAMAELSSGIIYIMLPSDTHGTDWWHESVWKLYEWPNLGLAVMEVIGVNPLGTLDSAARRQF